MTEPIAGVHPTAAIVVVADELDLPRVVARLERRYGPDYDVSGVGSGADGLARLSNLRDVGQEGAIVLRQAAIHLARFAAHVTLVVRGPLLDAGMSDYRVRELAAHANGTVLVSTEIAEARADAAGRLRSVVLRDRVLGTTQEMPAAAIFVLIGVAPRSDWLPESLMRDAHGFVLTGAALGSDTKTSSSASVGTSLAGVFAVGDVRADSIKRVASAVGEGSATIGFVHEYLAELSEGVAT